MSVAMSSALRSRARLHAMALSSLTLFALLGCSNVESPKNAIPAEADELLELAEIFELLSLDPSPVVDGSDDVGGFHQWRVLGQLSIDDEATRRTIVENLRKGVEEHNGTTAICFNPRHGIRVTRAGKTADFVICLECFRAFVCIDQSPPQDFGISLGSHFFNSILRNAGVPTESSHPEIEMQLNWPPRGGCGGGRPWSSPQPIQLKLPSLEELAPPIRRVTSSPSASR